jgi:ribosome biogenesis GTPase A
MAKTRRMIREHLPLVDVVLELTDARAPLSTHIPDLEELLGFRKNIIVALNKADLADQDITKLWVKKFKEMNINAVEVDTPGRRGLHRLIDLIKEAAGENLRRAARCVVVGVPNVGKSSIINQMVGRKVAKTGDMPGVTKGKMWLKVDKKLELLDTPGILWPKIESKSTGIKLALLGCIKDELLNIEELSMLLIGFLSNRHPDGLISRYKVDPSKNPREILEQIAKNRGFLLSGGFPDIYRSARVVISEFRRGRLGKISLEIPGQQEFWQEPNLHGLKGP